MPWKVTSHVKERVRFVEAWLSDEHESMTALCREFGISRKTGYKWLARFKDGGGIAPKKWTVFKRRCSRLEGLS